jgi:F-type H+-transporting ATPase subunit epsilon
MANDPVFRCSVITPEAAALEAEVTSVVLPAHDGQIGILRDRAPLLCKLGIGELRVDTLEGMRRFYVDGGFAQIVQNNLIVLTQEAIAAEDLDGEAARAELDDARAVSAPTLEAQDKRGRDMTRARTKLRILGQQS